MNTNRTLQKILEDLEHLDKELTNLAQVCEFTRQRRLCAESQSLLQGVHNSLEKGFSDLSSHETYTGTLDRI